MVQQGESAGAHYGPHSGPHSGPHYVVVKNSGQN
jgi:hypothetical protein